MFEWNNQRNIMLFNSPTLRMEEETVIKAISRMHKELRYSLSTPVVWEGVLRRNAFARNIRGSNSIEGYLVSKDDAIAAAEGAEQPLTAKHESWRAVVGYQRALTYVCQLAKDPDFAFSEDYLRSFHFMMLQHDLLKRPGNYRPGMIYVRDEVKGENVYEAPPSSDVPKFMAELMAYLNSDKDSNHLPVKGAMAHLNLVMIHPYSDGNGRMARCLQTLVLSAEGIVDPVFSSIEEYLGRNSLEYYRVLADVGQGKWNPKNDTRPWIRFNLTAHYRQAGTALRRMRIIAKLWDELEREVAKHGLPERAIFALSDAAMGLTVRSSSYREHTESSKVTASHDMNAMIGSGLLKAIGKARGRIYIGTDYLKSKLIEIAQKEPKLTTDPFAVGIQSIA